MFFEKLADQRCPERHTLCRIDQKMPIVPECRQQMIFYDSSGTDEGLMHSLGKLRSKIAVVFGIYPKHWNPRSATEMSSVVNELVGSTIIVWLAVHSPPPSCGEGNDRADRR